MAGLKERSAEKTKLASQPRPTGVDREKTEVTATFLPEAYKLYTSKNVRPDLILPTLRILVAHLGTHGLGREPEALSAAALYIAFRHPNTYPNLVPRSYFASYGTKPTKRTISIQLFTKPFAAKDSSIDWYVKQITKRLKLIVLHDERGLPYFLEQKGPIYRLIDALAEEAAVDAVLMSHVTNRQELIEPLLSGLLDRIFNTLKLLPKIFRSSLYEQLAPHVNKLVEDAKWALSR